MFNFRLQLISSLCQESRTKGRCKPELCVALLVAVIPTQTPLISSHSMQFSPLRQRDCVLFIYLRKQDDAASPNVNESQPDYACDQLRAPWCNVIAVFLHLQHWLNELDTLILQNMATDCCWLHLVSANLGVVSIEFLRALDRRRPFSCCNIWLMDESNIASDWTLWWHRDTDEDIQWLSQILTSC